MKMNKIDKKIPLTLDRMLHLICYNWGICSEVEEIITKLVFWGDWRPSLLECPRLNFADVCDIKLKWMRHHQPFQSKFHLFNYDGYIPSTTPHLDKISIYKENLTRSDIIEIKKYYLARVFTTRFSAFVSFSASYKVERSGIIKKPYRKLSIKTFNGEEGRYYATNYW
jgi:hypothetical protein